MRKGGRCGALFGMMMAIVTTALIDATRFCRRSPRADGGNRGADRRSRLFTGDSVDMNRDAAQRLADAARRAQAPGACPVGRLTINVPAGDRPFQDSLGSARRDVVLAFLNSQGIDPSRFFADVAVGGTQNNVRLDLNVARDDVAPTVDVTWSPPKGTKVKVGTRITAKAVARDDANRWQSGIKTIDLTVEGGGLFGFHDFPQPPPTCERPPPPRTLEGVYIVPASPPPLVRLHAIAKDYAGNETDVWAEFPTGDWYGQIKWSQFSAGGEGHYGILDIAVAYDERGNLTGRAVGEDHLANNSCAIIISTPARTSAKVVGQYTPGANTMSLQFSSQRRC